MHYPAFATITDPSGGNQPGTARLGTTPRPGDIEGMELEDGQRVGRFLVVRDVEGNRHALAATSISAICETDDGVLLMLPGGKLVHVPMPLPDILRKLDCR